MASNVENVNVFSKKFTGGPLGLGDPDDRALRHVEDHVFITQLVKDRAHHEKCNDLISKFGKCMEHNNKGLKGFFSFITCKPEVDQMNACLGKYYKDKDFREECEQIYLDRRSRYRRTGIIEKDPYEKKPYYNSERQEFMAKLRAERKSREQNQTHNHDVK